MKVNYLPKNRFKNSYFRRILILGLVFVLGIVVFSFLDRFLISVFSPIWKAENVFSRNLQNGLNFFNAQKTLFQENLNLKDRIFSLELQLASISKDSSRQELFLQLLNQGRVQDTVLAAVITHPPQTPYDIIIIDAGSDNDIKVGSEVFLTEGPYLGIVKEVFPHKAKVELLSSGGVETDAILERGLVPVKLKGIGGGNFKIELPQNISVEKGDRIISSDINERLIAVVGHINVRATDSFKVVMSYSPINIFNARFVFVAL